MAVQLTLNGKTFNYPEQGEDPIWGEEATAWAEEVTAVLNDIVTPGDILQTTFTVANNQAIAADVVGLLLDTSTVRSAVIEYSIYRVSTSNPSGYAESGNIYAVYDNSASSGNKWIFNQASVGTSGVTLTVGDDGQFKYTSTDIGTLGYSGTMKFRSRSLSQ